MLIFRIERLSNKKFLTILQKTCLILRGIGVVDWIVTV